MSDQASRDSYHSTCFTHKNIYNTKVSKNKAVLL